MDPGTEVPTRIVERSALPAVHARRCRRQRSRLRVLVASTCRPEGGHARLYQDPEDKVSRSTRREWWHVDAVDAESASSVDDWAVLPDGAVAFVART